MISPSVNNKHAIVNLLMTSVAVSFALILTACGEDSNSVSDYSSAPTSEFELDLAVATYDDLSVCTAKREGLIVYVEDEGKTYICIDGDWNEDDKKTEASSSSLSSSSIVQSSSSLGKNSSSSAKSSSSQKTESSSSEITEPAEESSSSSEELESSSGESPFNPEIEYGELIDSRDGQTYKTVVIGTQTWMAQNLNYETDSSFCYNDSVKYCTMYGRFYTWSFSSSACPDGWHLPSKVEWELLLTEIGGESIASKVLKSTIGWNENGNSTNAFGFTILPSGSKRDNGKYDGEGGFARFWSSTEHDSKYVFYLYLDDKHDNAQLVKIEKNYGFSIRCIQGEVPEHVAELDSSDLK